MRRISASALGAICLLGLVAGSASARGSDFKSDVVGIEVPFQVIAGVTGGRSPWVVSRGDVRINDKGKLKLKIKGLLIEGTSSPADGTVGPVTEVFASLVCQLGDPDEEFFEEVARTGNVPLSLLGDAKISEEILLPDVCVAPIVLIRVGRVDFLPFPIEEGWIAASGF